MKSTFRHRLAGQAYWWMPIALSLLAGLGFLIKSCMEQEPYIVGSVPNAPTGCFCYLHTNSEQKVQVHRSSGYFRIQPAPLGTVLIVCDAPGFTPVNGLRKIYPGENGIRLNFPKTTTKPPHADQPSLPTAAADVAESSLGETSSAEKAKFLWTMADKQKATAASPSTPVPVKRALLQQAVENYSESTALLPNDPVLRRKLQDVEQTLTRLNEGTQE